MNLRFHENILVQMIVYCAIYFKVIVLLKTHLLGNIAHFNNEQYKSHSQFFLGATRDICAV